MGKPETAFKTGTNFSRSDVEVVHPSYQPSKAELEKDMRVDATFEEAVQALANPVRIRYISRPKRGERR